MGASTAFHLAEAGRPTSCCSSATSSAAARPRRPRAACGRSSPTRSTSSSARAASRRSALRRRGRARRSTCTGSATCSCSPPRATSTRSTPQRRAAERARRADPDASRAEAGALVCPLIARDDVLAASYSPERRRTARPSRSCWATRPARAGTAPRVLDRRRGARVRRAGDDVTRVRTTRGAVAAGAVVCAAGAWSRALGEMAGVELPVTPLRRQILVTEPLPRPGRRRRPCR